CALPILGGRALGRAAPVHPHLVGALARAKNPLCEQAALAGALTADDGHELRRLIAHGALEHAIERAQFLDATDEFRLFAEHRERIRRISPGHEAGKSTTGFAARVVALFPDHARAGPGLS